MERNANIADGRRLIYGLFRDGGLEKELTVQEMLATDLEKVLTRISESYFCAPSSSSGSKVRSIFGLGASRVSSSAAEVAIGRVNKSKVAK